MSNGQTKNGASEKEIIRALQSEDKPVLQDLSIQSFSDAVYIAEGGEKADTSGGLHGRYGFASKQLKGWGIKDKAGAEEKFKSIVRERGDRWSTRTGKPWISGEGNLNLEYIEAFGRNWSPTITGDAREVTTKEGKPGYRGKISGTNWEDTLRPGEHDKNPNWLPNVYKSMGAGEYKPSGLGRYELYKQDYN